MAGRNKRYPARKALGEVIAARFLLPLPADSKALLVTQRRTQGAGNSVADQKTP